MASKKLINISNLQKFLLKLNEKFALKKAMKGISEDFEGNIIIGEEGLVPAPNENSKGKFLRSDGEWAVPGDSPLYDSMTIEEGVAGVSEVDKVLNAKNLKQIVNSDGFLTSLDSSKLTGIINIENLPQGALERILIVSSKEERLTLSDTEVQLGDVVKEADTGLMYYVINTEKLNSEEGYTQFTAGMASSVPWGGVTNKPTIPTKTSELTNDSNFAIDSNVVHKSGNETISGTKTFSNRLISNKELHYTDTKYDWSDTALNTWCNAGHVAWFDKTGNRRMHELVGANGGVWRKACFINENQYFSVDSNRNASFYATVSFNGNVYAYNNIFHKNNNMDITTKPSSTLYSNYIFKDKNEKTLSYIQYVHSSDGTNALGCFLQDNKNKLYGVSVNTAKEFCPFGDNTYSLGKSNLRWANAYIANTYTNRVTTFSITHHTDDSYFFVSGGTDYNKGATLYLGGVSATNFTPGRFALAARKTDGSSIELAGSPNGTLTWAGQNIALDGNVVHRTGDETINGAKTFTHDICKKNNALDLQVNPSATQYNSFLFTDKNNAVMGYLEHIQTTTGVNALGLIARDKNHGSHGIQVTSEDNVIPLGNGVVNLGLSGSKWKNVYATTFNGKLQGNADSSTKSSYLDNYSNAGGNKIYLDWDGQVKSYVGLKVDNTLMGGLITTKSIGYQSVNSATKATQDSAGQQINKTYIKELSVSGRTITYKRGDNTTGTITTQDTNTTYSKLSQFTNDSGFITSSGSCKYATSAGSANSVAWANVTGKPNLAGTTFVKGTNYWYRKHSDGFIEQGGFTNCADKTGYHVATNLPIAFSNSNYTVLVQLTRGTGAGDRWGDDYMLPFTQTKTTTRFVVFSNHLSETGNNGGGYDWYACGY